MIVSIYGRNNAGKTTLANMLVDKYNFVRLSFAGALREIVKSYFGIDNSWKTDTFWNMYSDKKYLTGVESLFSIINNANDIKYLMLNRVSKATTKRQAYRITMELVGTELFRNLILKDIWIAITVFNVFRYLGEGKNIVIDDMRFNNEYEVLSNLNAVFIKIVSPFEEPMGTHESQKYTDDFRKDYVIYNDGTKDDLFEKFKELNINV